MDVIVEWESGEEPPGRPKQARASSSMELIQALRGGLGATRFVRGEPRVGIATAMGAQWLPQNVCSAGWVALSGRKIQEPELEGSTELVDIWAMGPAWRDPARIESFAQWAWMEAEKMELAREAKGPSALGRSPRM